MKILALETSTLTGSVALVEDGVLVGETLLGVSVRHSESLLPAIDRLLKDARLLSKDIDLYAVSTGPGSFTGLRIGLATAQGFGAAHGKPVIGISSLEGLAQNAFYFSGVVVPVVNAFRSEVYRGFFERNGNELVLLQPEAAVSVQVLAQELKDLKKPAILLGNGVAICPSEVFSATGVTAASPVFHTPRASHIATLAARAFTSHASESLAPPLPRYLRVPG